MLLTAEKEIVSPADGLRVKELAIRFLKHCEGYYVKNGVATSQVRLVRLSLAVLNDLFAHPFARDFGPLALQSLSARASAGTSATAGRSSSGRRSAGGQ